MNENQNEYSHGEALASYKERDGVMRRFIAEHLVERVDFGAIPGTQGGLTLFKPGAEKLCIFLGLAPLVEVSQRLEDWEKGFVSYEVKVTLLDKRKPGLVVAEGVGSCNSRERKYKNQDAANVANTLLKMAKKRAFIDAALAASGAGEMFSDEDEDRSDRAANSQQAPRPASTRDSASRANAAPRENTPRGQYAPTPNAPAADETQRAAIETMAAQIWPGAWQAEALKITGGTRIENLDRPAANKLIAHLRALPSSASARQAA